MNWRKLNRVLHRDIGYFFFGMSIIYGISGIALNHIDDWDPSYQIRSEQIQVEPAQVGRAMTRDEVKDLLDDINVNASLKNFYYPASQTLKIFVSGGTVNIDLVSGKGLVEIVSRRLFLFEFNFLHYNNPKFLWTWFADLYGAGLVVMAITGILLLRGKQGFSGRGKWFIGAGLLIPLIFLLFYL